MKIYNVHYAMNGEEHDYVIEARSESDALTSCWIDNAVCEEGEETYIVLWCDKLTDCEENRQLLSKEQRPKMTKSEFIDLARKKGVQNDSTNVWVDIDDVVCIISIDDVLDHEETYPFEASDYLESNLDASAWDYLYEQYCG